jgi:hypothetical protein
MATADVTAYERNNFGIGMSMRRNLDANNLQQSWRFDGEPPKAVLRDFGTIDWILGG